MKKAHFCACFTGGASVAGENKWQGINDGQRGV